MYPMMYESDLLMMYIWWLGLHIQIATYWSERSACAARAALQTGCVANKVATKKKIIEKSELSEMARKLIEEFFSI